MIAATRSTATVTAARFQCEGLERRGVPADGATEHKFGARFGVLRLERAFAVQLSSLRPSWALGQALCALQVLHVPRAVMARVAEVRSAAR